MSEPTIPPPPSYTPPPPPGGMPPPPGGTPGGTASPNRTIMIVLSYLGLLALIPFLVEKDDREVQWHARNGLLLFAAEVVVIIVLQIFSSVMAFVDFGCTGCVLMWVVALIMFVVHIIAIVKGVNGDRLIIPGLSQYADRF
jgi:uncharacterized membrane protein